MGLKIMSEVQVNLNIHEIGILLSAIQNLEIAEERYIARDYGSAPALYNKLYSFWEQMDKSQIGLVNDVVPSF
jgi:hypothetical protein